MAQLTDLSDLIYDNQPGPFVQTYLECLIEGYSLKFPMDTNKDALETAWTSIITKLESDFDEDFIPSVSKKWARLLSQVKGNIDSTTPKEFYELLTGEDYLTPLGDRKADRSYYSRNMDPLKAPKDGGVSDSYYKQKEIEATTPLPIKEILKRKKAAFKDKDADLFLIYHLSIVRHQKTPKVPLSSLPETILQRWEEIVLKEYSKPLSDEFGAALASKWYYYVNQKGIPNTLKGIQNILFALMIDSNNIDNTSSQQSISKEIKKSGGFFSGLFGKK